MTDKPPDHERLVRCYLNVREARAQLTRDYNAKDAELKAVQDTFGMALLKILQDTKSKSIRTDKGTFYKTVVTMPNVKDWAAFYDWMAEQKAFDALERRVKRTFITEYMEANAGELPPGVSVFSQTEVHVKTA